MRQRPQAYHKSNTLHTKHSHNEWKTHSYTKLQIVLQEITQWLNGRFDQNPAFVADLKPDRMIVLTPKDSHFAAVIQRIELVLSKQPGAMKSVTIYEGADSYTRLEFHDVVLNRPLPDSLFQKVS